MAYDPSTASQTTAKLLTIENLKAYNHQLCSKLGLTQDTALYNYAEYTGTSKPTNIKQAIDDLYGKIEGITDKYVTVANQAITSTGGLISGSLSITSDANGGSATLSVNPTLTTSTGTATAIATDKYVEEQLAANKIEYSFGADAAFEKVDGEEKYTVTVPLMKKVGTGSASEADSIVLTLNSSEFVKDSFLQSAKIGTGDKANYLILTMKLADGTTKDIEVNLAQFIDAYTAGKGIDITSNKVSVDVAADGYLGFSADSDAGKLTILDTKLAKGTSTAGAAATNLATQGYVDDAVAGQTVTVDKTDVSAFGNSGSIDVKQNGTSVGKFTVTLPAFTAPTTGNVKPAISSTGVITVTVEEQGATDTATYTNTKLARASYVDEKVAEAKASTTYTAGNGINTIATAGDDKNKISVKAGSYVKVDANGVSVDTSKIQGYSATEAKTGDNNLASKKYVDDNKISVQDGANVTDEPTGYKSQNGIYVTTDGTTVTVGAVVATNAEIEAIFA